MNNVRLIESHNVPLHVTSLKKRSGKFILYNKLTTDKDIVDIYITFSQVNIFKQTIELLFLDSFYIIS